MSHHDHIDQVERAKLGGEQPAERQIRDLLAEVVEATNTAHSLARERFGAAVHGHSVNERLSDLYRELGETSRAASNAGAHLAVLLADEKASEPPPPSATPASPRPARKAP